MTHPRISLCIPPLDRAALLPTSLESALREAASVAEGVAEIRVSDNGSPDETPAVVEAFRARWPGLRSFRFGTYKGIDANYLNCMQQAL